MHNPRPWEIVGGRNERAKRIFAGERVYARRTRIREIEEEKGGSANWKWKKDGEGGEERGREGGRERIHLDLASNAHVRNGVPRSRKVEENEKL